MSEPENSGTPHDSTDDEEKPQLVRGVYVYTGPKIIADSKIRLARWLERRGW